MTRLGLLVGDAEPALRGLVLALARRVHVVDGGADSCDAWLWAPGDPVRPPVGRRCAVWVPDGTSPVGVAAVVHVGTGAAPAGVRPWVRVPAEPGNVDQARPFSPFSRSRLRAARGLPAAVATAGYDGWTWDGAPVTHGLADTLLATAAAVACTGPDVLRALAWAAPVVTDQATTEAHGLQPGIEVLVANSQEQRVELARGLAGDLRLAAALSTAGRRAYEQRSAACAADRLLDYLAAGPPADRLDALLSSMGTPSGAPVRARAARAVPSPEPR